MTISEEQNIKALIWDCLNHYDFDDALFLSELLFAISPTTDAIYLLATSYYRSGQIMSAYMFLKTHGANSSDAKYLFAKCCMDLNKFTDAENILTRDILPECETNAVSAESDATEQKKEGKSTLYPFAQNLMGSLCLKTSRKAEAAEHFRKSHARNPLLMSSFRSASLLGEKIDSTSFEIAPKKPRLCTQTTVRSPTIQSGMELKTGISIGCGGPSNVSSQVLPKVVTVHATSSKHTRKRESSHSRAHASSESLSSPAVCVPGSLTISGIESFSSVNDTATPGGGLQSIPVSTPYQDSDSFDAPPRLNRKKLGDRPRHNAAIVSAAGPTVGSGSAHAVFAPLTQNQCPADRLRRSTRLSMKMSKENTKGPAGQRKGTGPGGPPGSRLKKKQDQSNSDHEHGSKEHGYKSTTSSDIIVEELNARNQQQNFLSPSNRLQQNQNNNAASYSQYGSSGMSRNGAINGNQQPVLVPNLKVKYHQNHHQSGGHSGTAGAPQRLALNGISQSANSALGVVDRAATGGGLEGKHSFGGDRHLPGSAGGIGIKRTSNGAGVVGSQSNDSCNTPSDQRGMVVAVDDKCVGTEPASLSDTVVQCDPCDIDATMLPLSTDADNEARLDKLISMLKICAEIESAVIDFDCDRVLSLVNSLPYELVDSPWSFYMMGRTHFELANYDKATSYFQRHREKAPYSLRGMDYYSTALWFLSKEVELSALSQELVSHFRYSPETWCAAGNCFSLQNERETAVKFFERAVQLNPNYLFAYNLLGFEYLDLEEYEKSQQCFRAGIRIEPRNYKSWFGIGSYYYKLGKMDLAGINFKKALAFNPTNPVVACHLSVVLQRQHKLDDALSLLERTLTRQPTHSLSLYRKSECLFAQARYDDALAILEDLKQVLPRESKVFLLAGKVLKKLNRNHLALMHLSWATDLDPRGGVHQPISANDRQDEEPVTALATMDSDDQLSNPLQPMESDEFTI